MAGTRKLERVSFKEFKRVVGSLQNSSPTRKGFKHGEYTWVYREYPDFNDGYPGPDNLAAIIVGLSSNIAYWAKDPEILQVGGFYVKDPSYLNLFPDIIKRVVDHIKKDKPKTEVTKTKYENGKSVSEEATIGAKFIAGYVDAYPKEKHLHKGYLNAGFYLTEERYENLGTKTPKNDLIPRQSENTNPALGTSSEKKKAKKFDEYKKLAQSSENLPDKRDFRSNVKRVRYIYPFRMSIDEIEQEYSSVRVLPNSRYDNKKVS